MPIRVDTLEDRLVLKTFNLPDFDAFHAVMKAPGSGAYWHKEEKLWRIKAATWERLFEALQDLDIITITADAEAFMERARSIPERLQTIETGFRLSELRVPPLKGKHPYEDYQLDDLFDLLTHNRFGLYNEQGTGKSWELLSMVHLRYERRESRKILFITSNSGVYNIWLEAQRFTSIPVERMVMASAEDRLPFREDVDLVISNYGTMRLIFEAYRRTRTGSIGPAQKFVKAYKKWLEGNTGTLICDEAQGISHMDSQQSEIMHRISDQLVEYAYPATGTPADVEQKWYSQLRFLDHKLVKGMTYSEWCAEYFHIGNAYSASAIVRIKDEKKQELQDLVAQYSLRRFAGDVLDLPPHFIRDVLVPMSPRHREIYRRVVLARLAEIQTEEGGIPLQAIQRDALGSPNQNRFPYLIMALDSPELLLKHEDKLGFEIAQLIRGFNFEAEHSKLEALLDLLEKHKGEKIIIWNSHPSVGTHLAHLLARYKPLVLNGTTKIPKGKTLDQFKGEMIAEFQSSPDRNILILGQQVMNSSVTIVQCHVQILWDMNYNYVEFDQLLKRVHRYGQTKTVRTYILVIDESIDVGRRLNIRDKDWVNKMFLTSEYLSTQDVRRVFNLRWEDVA